MTYHANEAFRLNKYENCGKILKSFGAFELVNVLTIKKNQVNYS